MLENYFNTLEDLVSYVNIYMPVVGLKALCNPAALYLFLSMMAIFIMGIQNLGNQTIYCLGSYNCNVSSTVMIFVIKIMYVLFWTWLLNVMCRSGFTYISWILVLFPFITLFIAIASIFFIDFTNPFSISSLINIRNYNIPIFSPFYQWMRY